MPLLDDWLLSPEDYQEHLIIENYLDRLLGGYTLKFVMNRYINESDHLIDNQRLKCIIRGISDAIEHRGLDLSFEWEYGRGVLLHNYKPNFNRGCNHDYKSKEGCSTGC